MRKLKSIDNSTILTAEQIERKSSLANFSKKMMKNKGAVIGSLILLFFIITSVFAPLFTTFPVNEMNFENSLKGPSVENWLGTDEFGRDIWTRILYGGRVSLLMGLFAVVISGTIGVILGVVAGYYRKLDMYIMQFIDILMVFPSLLMAIAIVAVLGVSLLNAMIAVAISAVPSFVRVVRGAVLTIRETEYVEAARALGLKNGKIIFKHILPNVTSPIIILATLEFGSAILSAASLSFLGLGAQPPNPEWGALVYVGKSFLSQAWWMTLFPGLAIMFVVLGFNLLGDGLRDALDPKSK